ncbi:hypothetical protein JTB14_027442 [Gonioctena quinquepunctata]|nr:hypothetical protein JTB14_027442 [Gonioctena quinquepunctata]
MTSTRSNEKGEDELLTTIKSVVTNLCCSKDLINILCKSITQIFTGKFEKEINNLRKENENLQATIKCLTVTIKEMLKKREHFNNIHAARTFESME